MERLKNFLYKLKQLFSEESEPNIKVTGVSYDSQKQRYRARGKTENGKRPHLGWYRTEEEAEDAVSVYTKSATEADFSNLKEQIDSEQQYIKIPVTRRWRTWPSGFLTRVLDRISR